MSEAESSSLVPARRGLFASAPVRNGVHLGLSFCAVFMAFSVSQNFQTSSDHKEAGSTALGILCTNTAQRRADAAALARTARTRWRSIPHTV